MVETCDLPHFIQFFVTLFLKSLSLQIFHLHDSSKSLEFSHQDRFEMKVQALFYKLEPMRMESCNAWAAAKPYKHQPNSKILDVIVALCNESHGISKDKFPRTLDLLQSFEEGISLLS